MELLESFMDQVLFPALDQVIDDCMNDNDRKEEKKK